MLPNVLLLQKTACLAASLSAFSPVLPTFSKLVLVVQLLHVPAKKLDFPLGSPLHAEAAHQEDVGMDIVFSIQPITVEEGKAHKDR